MSNPVNSDNRTDKRLIEDYIPIKLISAEASREKSIRHGHISTLHLWWARRPLVAARAAVFGALVQADAKPQYIDPATKQPMTLNKLMIELCKWKLTPGILEEAKRLIREAYPDNPPKVLDMFAGGGSIPLEALRLGAEAYALDLNPVAHIIELATLVYPQKYGPQLAEDVRKWGEWVLERVKAEVGDLYPLIPDPAYTAERAAIFEARPTQTRMFPSGMPEQMTLNDAGSHLPDANDGDANPIDDAGEDADSDAIPTDIPHGYLQPVAYLWTRTVTCPNPACRATVPLVRQTWLKKKKNDNVALAMIRHPTENRMAFYVRRATDPADFGFDPAGFSQRGNSVCGICGTTVTSDYVKIEGKAKRMSAQMMATVCVRAGKSGKVYLSPNEVELPTPDEDAIRARIEYLTAETGITPPIENMVAENMDLLAARGFGFKTFADLFTSRQMLTLLTFVKHMHVAHQVMTETGNDDEYTKVIITYLALLLDKVTDYNSSLCRWRTGEYVNSTYTGQSLPMVWDFAEANAFGGSSGSATNMLDWMILVLQQVVDGIVPIVQRGSATKLPFVDNLVDAVVTDPPYYDNISYSDLSDFYYVWLRRSLEFFYPEHFSGKLAPKKNEAIAARYRHNNKIEAHEFYEYTMLKVFQEAQRVLKTNGSIVTVYAHKTTAGWSTLVDALRKTGFAVTEAWPVDTEMASRTVAMGTAALASSIFLVGRKRGDELTGNYQTDVLPEMRRIISERVRFFLMPEIGVTGADLNIAAVGAGLAPFTRYARVELPNGDELTASAYLDEVQAEVVRVLLGEAANADKATQYYIIARENYGEAWVDFDEANNLARATGIELDTGVNALTRGKSALIEKKGAKIRLRNYAERGADELLGLPPGIFSGVATFAHASLIDVLHRLLWLADNDNSKISDVLAITMPDRHLLRVVAESLKGSALAGEPTPGAVRDERTGEQRAINVLLASWRRVVNEGNLV